MRILGRVVLCVVALLVAALPVMAMQAAPPAAPAAAVGVDSFTQWDLATFFGLSAGVVGAIGALKKLFPAWTKGKEAHLGLIFSYGLGISAKLFMSDAYAKIQWVPFLLALLLVAAGAKFGHDYLLNKLIKNKPD